MNRTHAAGPIGLGFAVLAALAPLASFPAAAAVPAGFVDETIAGGLDAPTSFAFLPDGRILVTEQISGRVRLIVNGQIAPVDPLTLSDVSTVNERGILGIAVDPRWPTVPWVYINYTRTNFTQRIMRYVATGALTDPNSTNLSLGSPLPLIDDIPDVAQNHNAGCMRFGADDCLYVSLGDDDVPCAARDSTTLRGAILRLQVTTLPGGTGSQVARSVITPPDNPFVSSPSLNARLVHSFGYRNQFRFQIDAATGTLVVGDVGDGSEEEVDLADAGDFMGWPWREGNLVRDRPECPGNRAGRAPIWTIPHNQPVGYAVISAGRYRPVSGGSANWPVEYHGDVFFGQYYQGYLRRLRFNGSSWSLAPAVAGQPNSTDWATGLMASVDFQVGPDGSLWWLAQFAPNFAPSSGSLHRIRSSTPSTAAGGALAGGALRAAPNPFRETTELSIALARPAAVDLAIFDLSGRRVRTLSRGEAAAGVHPFAWDGTDDRGAPVRPGVYAARLVRDDEPVEVARVVRLR